jgi:hypothetical protein
MERDQITVTIERICGVVGGWGEKHTNYIDWKKLKE